ncbi:phosphatase PAP2 family protein [Photobacterium damselae]|uniref:phosphatase PAP2 family protein n=1 Tax=Photobacterium damselae TaxID=38293 RepID=UPI001F169F75|nr:phosphatase PAP2 family protein [Photobacterium damselae]UKA03961.1 phosphatase PAP2 family protein [Photobacterium damselae subsp. damselae]
MVKQDDIGVSQAVEGFVYTTATTHLLKNTIHASRPDNSGNNSFPSGHTSAAAQGAAFLQYRYGWKYGVPAYLLTGLVGYSRVEADKHYWRDVIAGAAIASGIQYIISKTPYSVTNMVITPMLDDNSVGMKISIPF